MIPTPEHDKLHKAKAELGTEEIGAFLEWLGHDGIQLARYWEHEKNCESQDHRDDRYDCLDEASWRWFTHDKEDCLREREGVLVLAHEPIMKLLARYADIDLERLEDEKRALLEEVRQGSTKR